MDYNLLPGEEQYDGGSQEQPVNPLLLVHRCLRGRYTLAFVLAVLFGIPAGIGGYMVLKPEYTSTGMVHVAPSKNFVLYRNEHNEPMTAFDSYVQSQANTLRSDRILSMAFNSPKFQQSGWERGAEGYRKFVHGVEVTAPRRGEDIFVNVAYTDPAKAKAGVDAILEAYEKVAIEKEQQDIQSTINELTTLTNKYQQESQNARNTAYTLAESEGTDDVQRRLSALQDKWTVLNNLILDYQIRLVPFGGAEKQPVEAQQENAADETNTTTKVPVEVLAKSDPDLAKLLNERDRAQLEYNSLRKRYSDEHRAVQNAKRDLAMINQMIEARANLAAENTTGMPDAAALAGPNAEKALRAQLAVLVKLQNETDAEIKRLGKVGLQIEKLREQAAQADKHFTLANDRLQALTVERDASTVGRISITQKGSTPFEASTDRRLPLAAIGGVGGAGFGVAIVTVIGFLFPKYRYIDDIDSATRDVFVFGAVPELDPTDPESRELVAASIHQIRSTIDARLLGSSERARMHLVTSAGSAEGKSTIALRLAKSFASSGRKTLLIDADMIGRRLTSEMNMWNEAGFADAVTNVANADSAQTVHGSPIPNLSFMPSGRTDRVDPEQISARRIEMLIDPLRDVFETIVVDSGPVLGSLEAQAATAVADEVMLVITRGREVRQVKLAIERLHMLSARKIGVIFNRASRQDIERSTSMSTTSQRIHDTSRNTWNHSENGSYSDSNEDNMPVARID